jgi:DNA adenine methylase
MDYAKTLLPATLREEFLSRLKSPQGYKQYRGSPLRYPGGKSRAVGFILEKFPDNLERVMSPFIGGGSVEIAIANELGIPVVGYDIFDVLINYWQVQLTHPRKLYNALNKVPRTKAEHARIRKILRKHWDGTQKLASFPLAVDYFFNFNTSYGPGFMGWPSSVYIGKGTKDRYESMIEKVRDFRAPNLKVKCASFEDSIPNHPNDFIYADPPYVLGGDSKMFAGIYPMRNIPVHHEGFNHELLRDLLWNHKGGFVLSYNDCSQVREWYKGLNIETPSWQYTMGQGDTRIGANRKKENKSEETYVKESHEVLIWRHSSA